MLLASCGGGGGVTTHPAPIVTPPDDQASTADITVSVTYDNYVEIDGKNYKDAIATFTNTSNATLKFDWGYVEHEESGGTVTVGMILPLELAPHETKTLSVQTFDAASEVNIYIGSRHF